MPFRILPRQSRLTKRTLHRRSPVRVKRHPPTRQGKPRILVLSEGRRTETNYFNGLKTVRDLGSVVVRPLKGQPGPVGLARRAERALANDSGWDEIYCVVDQDERHRAVRSLERELIALNQQSVDTSVRMIRSDPCFEFWLLLHYEFTDRPFVSAGKGRTACDAVTAELRRHLPRYQKNAPRVFEDFRDRLDHAIVNAGRLRSLHPAPGDNVPRTDADQLVERLLKI